jgi:Fe-S-cluster containining protein
MGVTVSKLKNGLMDFSVKELRALGYKEIYMPHDHCAAKTREGCMIYDDRPQLCRSYYCQGKYWRPKPQTKEKLTR